MCPKYELILPPKTITLRVKKKSTKMFSPIRREVSYNTLR
jgi:hypothetical protein